MRLFSPGKAAADPGHSHSIELKLRDMSQLFNSMDPSPFVEKDLDHDADEFIMSWAQEFPPGAPVKLRIYLEQWPVEDPNELIRQEEGFGRAGDRRCGHERGLRRPAPTSPRGDDAGARRRAHLRAPRCQRRVSHGMGGELSVPLRCSRARAHAGER